MPSVVLHTPWDRVDEIEMGSAVTPLATDRRRREVVDEPLHEVVQPDGGAITT